ncbi:MAG TPA: type II toxin-antitoxin system RelE/ParE family toxin [Paraburkholderia sp.]
MTDTTIWSVRLTKSAEQDFGDIIRWSAEQFGKAQARVYAETLSIAIQDLTSGPAVTGGIARDDILRGLFTLHVTRKGRKGRHFIMFRVADRENRVIDVLRVLHDAMDLPRHIPPSDRE